MQSGNKIPCWQLLLAIARMQPSQRHLRVQDAWQLWVNWTTICTVVTVVQFSLWAIALKVSMDSTTKSAIVVVAFMIIAVFAPLYCSIVVYAKSCRDVFIAGIICGTGTWLAYFVTRIGFFAATGWLEFSPDRSGGISDLMWLVLGFLGVSILWVPLYQISVRFADDFVRSHCCCCAYPIVLDKARCPECGNEYRSLDYYHPVRAIWESSIMSNVASKLLMYAVLLILIFATIRYYR